MAATIPISRAELIELIGKSRLLSEVDFNQLLQESESLPDDPKQLLETLVGRGLLTKFQADQLSLGRYKGFFLGKYKILQPLGRGGMGTVFLGEHVVMKHRVAIKVLPAKLAQDRSALERFRREAMAVAALRHPNIVRAHDIDHIGSTHFIVLEYVEGITLQALVHANGPLSIERATNYIYQAALGLQHVYEAGLVHRDIKPGNLMLEKPSNPQAPEVIKILDLGLARFNDRPDDQLTQVHDQGAVLGTADYLSPEQGLNSSAVDIRSDIYSLGGTFYYLLTGRTPFEGANTTQKLLAHQIREPEPISRLRPETPPPLIQIIARMLMKSPDDRFQTPNEVAAALAPFVVNTPPGSGVSWSALTPTVGADVSAATAVNKSVSQLRAVRSTGPATAAFVDEDLEQIFREDDPPKSNRGLIIGIISAVSVFAVGLLILLVVLSQRGGNPEPSHANQPPIVSPIVQPPVPKINQLITQPTIKPLRELPAHPAQVTLLSYAKDGITLLTAASDSQLRVWNTRTGQLLQTYAGHKDSQIGGVGILPDGQRAISVGVDERSLHLWDIRTGQLLKRSAEVASGIGRLTLSADGQMLATTSNQPGGPTILWDVPTLQPRAELTETHRGRVRWLLISNDSKYVITACVNRSVAIWYLDDLRQPQRQLTPLIDRTLQSISLAPDSSFLVTSTYLKTTRTLLSQLEVYDSKFAFSRNPTMLPVGRFELLQAQQAITDIQPVPGTPYTVLASMTGLELVDLVQTQSLATYTPKLNQPTDVWQLAVNPNGRELAVTFGDNVVRIFKLDESVR
jgi:serine/threonine protein kinase